MACNKLLGCGILSWVQNCRIFLSHHLRLIQHCSSLTSQVSLCSFRYMFMTKLWLGHLFKLLQHQFIIYVQTLHSRI
jgi:hypothetical protein